MNYQVIPVTAYQQNCSLIWCDQTGQAALIDPGGDVEVLLAAVERQGVQLVKLLLTHGHLDHVGGTKQIAEQLNIPIIGPQRADLFWLEALPRQCEMFNFPATEAFVPTQWLDEGDQVRLGEQVLDVLHCPGHTPGHVVFYHAAAQLAFVGDVLFAGSVGRSDFPQGDHATLIHSIKNKLLPLGDAVEFVPGHGPNSSFGHERMHNPFLNE